MRSIVRCNPGEGDSPRIKSPTVFAEAAPHPDPLPAKCGAREWRDSPQKRGEGADRNPVMTPLRLTAGAATFTVSTVLTAAANPTIPAHALHRHALDSLPHHCCAGAGRAQCDAAAVDRAARHLGRDQYPLPVRRSVFAGLLC